MFTLEDTNLTDDLEFFLTHGVDLFTTPHTENADHVTAPEADINLHPHDYFIAGA
ncbi:hypothetical protein KEM60_00412 [Austwickia sp. TVS 96-490-7B]|uniref:hypothetical protein n=1 Tax=Austwickia sp. TVS 96-490-7B TaxID=2830843 RepID=UPI001C587F78|nr:hypothetical protein [Austwickia sp. TVS 96-490-7B]MBW3084226.1 hypothetical protein [Austwickia sp. TVS 96-490-7B]